MVAFFFDFGFFFLSTDSKNKEPPVHVLDDTARRHFCDTHNGRYQPVVIFEGFPEYDRNAE